MTECLIDDTHFIRQGEVESRCWCLGNDTCGIVPCVLFRARADLPLFACLGGTRELQSGICGTRWSLAQHVPLTKPCPVNDVTCVDLLMMWIMMVGSISLPLIYNQAIDGRLAANQRDMDDSVGYHTGVIEAFQSLGSPCYEQNWNQMYIYVSSLGSSSLAGCWYSDIGNSIL